MPMQTEAHLSVIAEKIEAIQEIDADVCGNSPSFLQRRSAIPHLRTIGKSVSHVPEEFKNRHIEEIWRRMEVWGVRRNLSVRSIRTPWMDIVELLRGIEPDIHRHSGGDTEIQKEIISDMREKYRNLLQNRREQRIVPFLLITISGILVSVLFQLRPDEMDYGSLEISAFILHMIVLLFVPVYLIFFSLNLRSFDNVHYLYYTFTENYYVIYLQLRIQISELRYTERRFRLIVNLITVLWVYTLMLVILAYTIV